MTDFLIFMSEFHDYQYVFWGLATMFQLFLFGKRTPTRLEPRKDGVNTEGKHRFQG